MKLEDIKKSAELRQKLELATKEPNIQFLLDAIEKDTVDQLGMTTQQRAGQSIESAVAMHHARLAGRQEVLKIFRTIGNEIPKAQEEYTERPFDHAIPEQFRPESWLKPKFPITATT